MKLKEKFNYENILDHLKENDHLYINFLENKIYINKLPNNLKNYHLINKKDLFNELGIYKNKNNKKVFQNLTNVYHPYSNTLYFDLDSMELME